MMEGKYSSKHSSL